MFHVGDPLPARPRRRSNRRFPFGFISAGLKIGVEMRDGHCRDYCLNSQKGTKPPAGPALQALLDDNPYSPEVLDLGMRLGHVPLSLAANSDRRKVGARFGECV